MLKICFILPSLEKNNARFGFVFFFFPKHSSSRAALSTGQRKGCYDMALSKWNVCLVQWIVM